MNRSTRLQRREATQGYLSVLPVIVIILAIKGYPIVMSLIESFTNWDGLYRNHFVGFANYVNMVQSNELWLMLRNSSYLLLFIPVSLVTGLFVAMLLYEEVLGWRFFRAVFFLPQVVSPVIIGFLFHVFFGYQGPVNMVLKAVGLGGNMVWWSNAWSALTLIMFTLAWQSLGWQAVVYLAGMSSISTEIFDAAVIDGANYWQRTFRVVLPMLTRVVEYSILISIVWIFTGMFPFIYSMTNGGPGFQTTTIDYMVYLKGFVSGSNLGAASAVAVVLLLIVLVLSRLQITLANIADNWS